MIKCFKLLLATPALALTAASLQAQIATQEDVLRAELLPGWQMESGHHMAGLRLELAPGWKTYWRAPGDAGIPPRFDWTGSQNLASVILHWPSPTVFQTNGYQTIGYTDGLVLPIEIVPKDASQPVILNNVMELGICDDICMPAFLELEVIAAPPGVADPAIRSALKSLPVAAKKAGASEVTCTVDPIDDGLRVTARMHLPRQPGAETVAFEASDTAVWVSESLTTREGNVLTAIAEMVGPSGQPFVLDRSGLVLTVIHAKGAVEIIGCPAP